MVDSRSFGGQKAAKPHLVRGSGGLAGEINDLRGDVDEGFKGMETEVAGPGQEQGNIRINVQPTEGDLIDIGADTYEFVDTLAAGVAGGIEVLVGGAAATALANIVAAVNGTVDVGTDGDGVGTERVVASIYNTDFLHVEVANRPGGTPVPGTQPDIALAETIADSAVWDHGNLNLTGGQSPLRKALHIITVDAVNLAADFDIVVPGLPMSAATILVTDASNVPTAATFDTGYTLVPARNAVTVDLDGATTDPIATDKVYVEITYLAA